MSPAEVRQVLRRDLRLLRSELGLTFRRRRNLVLLIGIAAVPVLTAVAIRTSGAPGRGGSILGSVTDNGLFAALAAFLVVGPLFLPLVIAVVAGDSVAGEASAGTLRYLLAVPVGRTRLLAVKFTAVSIWSSSCVVVVAIVGELVGLVLFPSGDVVLLSGTSVGYGDGLIRLLLVAAYIALTASVVSAIGLFVSTLTEIPIAAMAATLALTIASEVVDAIPQLDAVHGWLPTHYWLQWVDLLRDPVPSGELVTGLLVTLAYVSIFCSLAWARFGGKDITS